MVGMDRISSSATNPQDFCSAMFHDPLTYESIKEGLWFIPRCPRPCSYHDNGTKKIIDEMWLPALKPMV